MRHSDGDKWITATDAAGLIGVALHTVHALIGRGELHAESFVPTDRPKRRPVTRLRREDVDDYLERARVKPGELAHLYPPPSNSPAPRERVRSGNGGVSCSRRPYTPPATAVR